MPVGLHVYVLLALLELDYRRRLSPFGIGPEGLESLRRAQQKAA